MTNPSQHSSKSTRNTSALRGIKKRLIEAPDKLWVGGVIRKVTRHTVREFRNPGCHEMVNVIRNRPDGNRFVSVQEPALQPALTPGADRSRMCVRLAKPESKIQQPLLELFGQPCTVGKAANEECELIVINQEPCSRISEHTDRVGGKALLEIIPDRVHGRLDRRFEEPRNLCPVWENFSVPIHS